MSYNISFFDILESEIFRLEQTIERSASFCLLIRKISIAKRIIKIINNILSE